MQSEFGSLNVGEASVREVDVFDFIILLIDPHLAPSLEQVILINSILHNAYHVLLAFETPISTFSLNLR
jgi:hypothetical protein